MPDTSAEAPKVSVVVPVFNTADFLDECLGSLVAQTLHDIEIICVDDGSTDGSAAILAGWAAKDSRIRVIRQENRGGGAARNAGQDAARGEWLFFCDSDDACEPEMLEDMVRRGDGTDAQVVVAPRHIWNRTLEKLVGITSLPKRLFSSESSFPGRSLGGDLFVFSGSTAWNKLFKRRFVTENRVRFREVRTRSDDLGFVDLALALAERISISGRALYRYRSGRAGGAVYSSESQNPCELFGAFDHLRGNLVSRGLFDEFLPAFSKALFISAGYQMSEFRRAESVALCHDRLRKSLLELRSSCDLAETGVLNEIQADAYRTLLESADPVPFLLSSWRGAVSKGNEVRVLYADAADKLRDERRRRETAEAALKEILAYPSAGFAKERARFEHSLSWRLTAPLRFAGRLAARLIGKGSK